ncbi:carbamoyl-phosphate synthase (glutamine-hydrolyzing) large subunit [Virgibacillus sp. MSP4-1]|uniref:carbamoyl-phosphate synthase (glutamine-hydrolyzing) large subunit n=1 Tax=Virgibacillus sp. MSP4-1 TaxID=2700081 RepID=UPI0003A91A96|nr:carbamoyl-phosphate synthase (glutamine-hydrolyzing) large subunit [Virgibacillus sp. MSP4-1]QHS22867.1 carbamoyl-phosphate synthase (glutamine-hydrolyzing) large subunit [Virgibacillus sp. MSP4-1]
MPKLPSIKKVLVIGSGPIVIGQAAEFDYAGTQACLALKEEGIEVVLVNNNPATIMTDPQFADQIYLEPLTCESVTKIIEQEKPDGLLPTLGGQTGLNLALSLTEAGVLDQYEVELLGTPLNSIQKGEDRERFKSMMINIDEPIAHSVPATSTKEAIEFADQTGYPIMIRPAYTLGGSGGGVAANQKELESIVMNGLQLSPIHQVLIEQSVKGWKEIEFEVMRDANDTCIIVCSMENIDPVGVHTGDSMVVAPVQTLTDRQYQMLRTTSCKVIRELGVVGGCNIQFAVHPERDEYVIIEVNPRVSRSSALASKATGYPIARIAAKLALGYHLDEVLNPITANTYASFEPAIDYIAVKLPRLPFDKFTDADRKLGTQMQATGEVMAIARNLPAAIQKAIRSLEIGADQLHLPSVQRLSHEQLQLQLAEASDERLFVIGEALRRGFSIETIHGITDIHPYFLYEISTIIEHENDLSHRAWGEMERKDWLTAKQLGFTNKTLAKLFKVSEHEIATEISHLPAYKMVDTCAAEFSADTPYYYSSWNEMDEVEKLDGSQKTVVIGSGPIRIGQGIEFDYCSVQAAMSLKDQGINSIVINNNPETVSTDFHTADHLYFEPLTAEDVIHIMQKEQADHVMVQFGGQTAINLAEDLQNAGFHIAGTSLSSIQKVEDRDQFYQMLTELNIPHIPGETIYAFQNAHDAAQTIGFPLLVRPSYVIGGKGMKVIQNDNQLDDYVNELEHELSVDSIYPLLMDRFITGKEFELDAVCDGSDIIIPGIFEHVEKAGIHSGDSMAIFPAPSLTEKDKETIFNYTQKISAKLNAKGLMNIQFVMDEATKDIFVLEVNPRASRTVPIVCKITGIPLIDLATKVQLGETLHSHPYEMGLHEDIPYYTVKMPIFSTEKLNGVDPITGPEMKSTGEAIGIGKTVPQAMAKAFHWSENKGTPPDEKNWILMTGSLDDDISSQLCTSLRKTDINIAATPETEQTLKRNGVEVAETLTKEEAKERFLKKSYTLLFTNQLEDSLQRELREYALKNGIMSFTATETLTAFLMASAESFHQPLSIQNYNNMIDCHQTEKESV